MTIVISQIKFEGRNYKQKLKLKLKLKKVGSQHTKFSSIAHIMLQRRTIEILNKYHENIRLNET